MKITRVGEIKLNALYYAGKFTVTCYNNYNLDDESIFWEYTYDPNDENSLNNANKTKLPTPSINEREGYLFR